MRVTAVRNGRVTVVGPQGAQTLTWDELDEAARLAESDVQPIYQRLAQEAVALVEQTDGPIEVEVEQDRDSRVWLRVTVSRHGIPIPGLLLPTERGNLATESEAYLVARNVTERLRRRGLVVHHLPGVRYAPAGC